eukprot:388582-Alexandrium_andersonii.AAC.1
MACYAVAVSPVAKHPIAALRTALCRVVDRKMANSRVPDAVFAAQSLDIDPCTHILVSRVLGLRRL